MSFPPISPTALVSLPELDRSASAFRHSGAPTETTPFPFGPTPQHTRAPSPIPACRNISAPRSRLPSHLYLPTRHPIMAPALLLPVPGCHWPDKELYGARPPQARPLQCFTLIRGLFAPCQMRQQLTRSQLGRPPFPHLACSQYLHPRTNIHRRPCHHNTGKAANRLRLELAPDGLEQDSVLPPYPKADTVPRTLGQRYHCAVTASVSPTMPWFLFER